MKFKKITLSFFFLRAVIILVIFYLFIIVTGCFSVNREGNLDGWKELIFRGKTMGTDYTIRFLIDEKLEKVKHYKEDIDKKLLAINKMMSTYDKESEISLLNASNLLTNFISIELSFLIDKSLHLSELTDGAYDITAGPLINLWGFGHTGKRKVPSPTEIQKIKKRVGYQTLKLITNQGQNILIKRKNQSVDLSSIAKGYGVDQVGLYLVKNDFTNYMVEIGGEVQTRGVNIRGKPWKIGIRAPSQKVVRLQKVVLLRNESLATSGDYENYFTVGGDSYSHIINPIEGKPITHNLVSVSVIHRECALADAWATALLVMGEKKGMALAIKNKISALFIIRDKEGRFIESWTAAFENNMN